MIAIKKAVKVEVWRLNHRDTFVTLPPFVLQHFDEIEPLDNGLWQITTPEGIMNAKDGDYLICGVMGEIYPCKREVFEKTYVIVNDAAANP